MLALKTWRCFIEGEHFILETDHSPLTYLQTQPLLSRKQARWLEFFEQFHFEVRYKKGIQNRVADALSRVKLSNLSTWQGKPSWSQEIQQALEVDQHARQARKTLGTDQSPWTG